MSTEWGTLVADWTPPTGESDDGDRDELVGEAEPDQEELEFSVYADSSMTLPGQGQEGPNCGVWKPAKFCDECADVGYAPNRCERRSCPNCDGLWTRQRAVGATRRLQAGRWAEPDGIDRRVVHGMLSPPPGEIRTLQQVRDGFRDAYRLAEEKGIRGGVVIFHGFRVKAEVQREFEREDPPMGIWRWVRKERVEDWRELTYWSPHYHVIGLCRDFEEDQQGEQEGWVARRVNEKPFAPMESLNGRESYEDVVGAVRYLLSHATFEAGTTRDCVRWYGEMATTKFKPDEEVSEGALETIERVTEEVVGEDAGAGEGAGEEENEVCEDCGATSWSPIFEAGAALMDKGWCERIGREREHQLMVAFEWAIGERKPPPGMKKPQNESQAKQALEELM